MAVLGALKSSDTLGGLFSGTCPVNVNNELVFVWLG